MSNRVDFQNGLQAGLIPAVYTIKPASVSAHESGNETAETRQVLPMSPSNGSDDYAPAWESLREGVQRYREEHPQSELQQAQQNQQAMLWFFLLLGMMQPQGMVLPEMGNNSFARARIPGGQNQAFINLLGQLYGNQALSSLGRPGSVPELRGTNGSLDYLVQAASELDLTVTSTTGGRHNAGSKHYRGEAIDVRASDMTPEKIAKLKALGIRVVDERQRPAGQAVWGGPHYHLEFTQEQYASLMQRNGLG